MHMGMIYMFALAQRPQTQVHFEFISTTKTFRLDHEGNTHSLYTISSIPITAAVNQEDKNQYSLICSI